MGNNEIYDFFCVDCDCVTKQMYNGVYVDDSFMYICQVCGCENYEDTDE